MQGDISVRENPKRIKSAFLDDEAEEEDDELGHLELEEDDENSQR